MSAKDITGEVFGRLRVVRKMPTTTHVIFRDGNRQNCSPDNLELVSREEMMRRNSVHTLPKELAQIIQLRGALNRKIRSKNRG